jgi:hypothetical protein
MIDSSGDRFALALPLLDAVRFSIGVTDLNYDQPNDELRQVVGLLAIDDLEYSEQWRVAGLLRSLLREKWPDSFP